jgi:hypothetical protein
MAERGDLSLEGAFEVIWHQHNPEDWMAEIRDIRTSQSCRVSSLGELEQFIHSHLQIEEPCPAEPKS